jgi:hypothetical protein
MQSQLSKQSIGYSVANAPSPVKVAVLGMKSREVFKINLKDISAWPR